MQAYVDNEGIFKANWDENYIQEGFTPVGVIYEGSFHLPKWNGTEFVEGLGPSELNQTLVGQAIHIDLVYTALIGELMVKHNDKYIEGLISGTPYVIPASVLTEKQRLKDECNAKILALGITDFTYRQNNPILAKGK